MTVETAPFIGDLVATNPPGTDTKGEGDNHIRLIKAAVQATLPNADRAQYFPRGLAKSGAYTILASDMESMLHVDASGAARTMTLPTLAATDDGWAIRIMKVDSSANAVTIAGTVNGVVNPTLAKQYDAAYVIWTGTAWRAMYFIASMAASTLLGRRDSAGVLERITLGSHLTMSSGGELNVLQASLDAKASLSGATFTGGVTATFVRTKEMIIAHGGFDFIDGITYATVMVASNGISGSHPRGLFAIRPGSPFIERLDTGPTQADVDLTTGALNGSTGVNTKFTMSASPAGTGRMYFENRTGSSRTVAALVVGG